MSRLLSLAMLALFFFSSSVLATRTFKLPSDFLWGFATSAYQIEGGVNEGGRGKTIWDTYSHTPGKIRNNETGDVAADSYHRWKDDVAIIKKYGAKSYRFSIAWSRIVPSGSRKDKVNEAGVAYYSNLVDELLKNGIVPFVTLFHWDVPQGIEDQYGGLLDTKQFPLDFAYYADIMFKRLGDRVKHWLTFNEPYVSALDAYGRSYFAPGDISNTKPYLAGHSILLAHAKAVQIYRQKYQKKQKGMISITLNCEWGEPYTNSKADKAAAQRYLEFFVAWFADPIYLTGDYPKSMRDQLGDRLPTFTRAERKLLLGSYDFFGLNHYTARYIADTGIPTSEVDPMDIDGNVIQYTTSVNGTLIGPQSAAEWLYSVPWGLEKLLKWLWNRYHVPIYITENGCASPNEDSMTLAEATNDTFRVNHFKGYLNDGVVAAMKAGVKVKSYFAWSLLDNFEWGDGYAVRFGVTYVNFTSLERTPKQSAYYISNFFKSLS